MVMDTTRIELIIDQIFSEDTSTLNILGNFKPLFNTYLDNNDGFALQNLISRVSDSYAINRTIDNLNIEYGDLNHVKLSGSFVKAPYMTIDALGDFVEVLRQSFNKFENDLGIDGREYVDVARQKFFKDYVNENHDYVNIDQALTNSFVKFDDPSMESMFDSYRQNFNAKGMYFLKDDAFTINMSKYIQETINDNPAFQARHFEDSFDLNNMVIKFNEGFNPVSFDAAVSIGYTLASDPAFIMNNVDSMLTHPGTIRDELNLDHLKDITDVEYYQNHPIVTEITVEEWVAS